MGDILFPDAHVSDVWQGPHCWFNSQELIIEAYKRQQRHNHVGNSVTSSLDQSMKQTSFVLAA
jgi:hypothetical protein